MAKLATVRNGNTLQRLDDFLTWDPFAEMANVRRTMNALLDSVLSPPTSLTAGGSVWSGYGVPAIDLYEKDNAYVIEAAVPGLKKDDIDIEVTTNSITLSAKKQEEKTEENERYHYREVRRGGFSRTITFPQDIDPEKVEATYQNGILHITIGMAKPVATKKVLVKG